MKLKNSFINPIFCSYLEHFFYNFFILPLDKYIKTIISKRQHNFILFTYYYLLKYELNHFQQCQK